MKILYVIGSMGLGGAEQQLFLLAEGVRCRGCDVQVFALDARGPLRERFESAGIIVIDGGFNSGYGDSRIGSYLTLFRSFMRLILWVFRKRFDVIHGFLPLTNFMASLAGRLSGAYVITSRRGLGTHQGRGTVWRWMDRLSNRFSHLVTANSFGVKDDVVQRDQISEEKIRVIYNGLKFERFSECMPLSGEYRKNLGVATTDIVIVNVANLIAYKGHDVLIRAFAKASEQFGNLKLWLVGDDRGISESLANLCRQLGVNEKVSFLGFQLNPESYMVASDIAVVASYEEGFSNFLIEAMYAENYAIATSVGGNAEALAGGELGELVPSGDYLAMSNAIIQACTFPEMRKAKSIQGRVVVANKYGVDQMVEAYLKLYKNR